LAGTDVPAGDVLQNLGDLDLNGCLMRCGSSSQCKGLSWTCSLETNGQCRLFSNVNWQGPSNCPNCIGYIV
jgi:hypothetical protein